MPQRQDVHTKWYQSGGYGYDPKQSRKWILEETSIPEFRGTCLDIGSGDGFWSWILCEWFYVYGIDPVEGGVELAKQIKKRLPLAMKRRVDFFVGDALEVSDKYDVVFCRAPSFFNYPIYKKFSTDMLDLDRTKLVEVWQKNGESEEMIAEKLKKYPPPPKYPSSTKSSDGYENNWREYLEKMKSITNKLFIFILSTKEGYMGQFIGDTYNHDPAEVEKIESVNI